MRRSTFLAAVLAALAATTFSASAQTTSILNDVIKRGEIRVATIAGNPPYSSLSPSGDPVGYDIDIANLIGAALKVKVKFLIVDVPGRIVALQTGRADITVANFTNTVERSTTIAFTDPYVVVGSKYMVLADSKFQTVAELDAAKGKVGFARGGTAEQTVTAASPNAEKVRFDTVGDAFLALQSGQVDAHLQDSLQNATYLAKYPGKFRNLPGNYSYEEISIGLPAGDFDWWRLMNTWVKQFNASGENARLFKKWFDYEMPPIKIPY